MIRIETWNGTRWVTTPIDEIERGKPIVIKVFDIPIEEESLQKEK